MILQRAGRLAVRVKTLVPESMFHTSAIMRSNESDFYHDKMQHESKKLHHLKSQLPNTSSPFAKWKLRSQILLLQNLIQAYKMQAGNKVKTPSLPLVRFDEDPVTIQNAQRQAEIVDCLRQAFATNLATKKLLTEDELIRAANLLSKETVITREQVKVYFKIFEDVLANPESFYRLRFDDEKVMKLFEIYCDTHFINHSAVLANNILKISEDAGVHDRTAMSWFHTFEAIHSVGNLREVSGLESIFPNFFKQGRVNIDFFANKDSNEQKPTETNEKAEKKDQKKKGKEEGKPFDVVIDLNRPPFQYFQLGILVGLGLYLFSSLTSESNHEISFQEFASKFLSKNLVSKLVIVNNRTALLELNENGKAQFPHSGSFYFSIGDVATFERSLESVQNEFNIPDTLRVPVVYVSEGSTGKFLVNLLPTFLFLGAIYYMTRKATMGGMGGPLGFGKSTAKKFNQETDVKIRFKDVAGMSEAKEEVMEFVKFLQNPEKYERLGAKIPRGAILSGPPGTGKTLIAKATAGEAGVPFYSVSGSEFVEMFVGVGASRVRDLFKTARENAPSIVFVDEIDAIGKQRSKGNASGANDERETTLNQLLVEMDGFDSSDHVVVLAGTNRADILDRALMRPGRFDRHIAIDNPELQGRKEIFQVHLRKIKLKKDIDADLPGRLAALTPGFSGADIANICNEAALIAARYNAESVTLRHFELAIERVIGGVEKKSKLLTPEEQKIVAYHEAGHAVCGWYLKYAHPLLKVSIIPRGQAALGYAQYLPPDQYLFSGLQLYDRMIMTLGGRVSEELHFSSVTSGAHDDFKKVTNIAQLMVLRFGMSEKVGMVNYADTRSSDDLTKPYSDRTNKVIDEEIHRIVGECYQKCKDLLTERSEEVKLVAEELIKKEFITREDMIRLLGKRPFPENNDAFDKYLEGNAAFKNEQPPEEKKDDESFGG